MNKFYNICWQDLGAISEVDLARHLLSTRQYLNDTLEHLVICALVYAAICVALYWLVASGRLPYDRTIERAKKVMFVISHPDDEVMFFGPTILHYVKRCDVYLMCLSTGRNYGMGSIRKRELYDSCNVLGIRPDNIIFSTHSDMPDKIDVKWPPDTLGKLLLSQLHKYDIDVLITFDRYGISRHLNHSSIYFAVANLMLERRMPKLCQVYVLETVDLLRKYWLIFDLPVTLLFSRFRYVVGCRQRHRIHRAMWQHKSQLMWFRLLYMLFSRYMLVNSLQKMDMSDVELDLELDD